MNNSDATVLISNLSSDQGNLTNFTEYVNSLRKESYPEIGLYSLLFVSGAIGNLWVFFKQRQKRHRDARVNYLLRHLNYADMMVIFGTILIEIIWRFTVVWYGGEVLCKIFQTFRIFGVYLSSVMVICISVDRYYVFVHPLSFINRERRKKILIHLSYAISAVSSLPQAFIFHIERHPHYPRFTQCLSSGYFAAEWQEKVYQIFTLCIMYFVPFFITLFCYIRIIGALNSQKEFNITLDMVDNSLSSSSSEADHHRISVFQRAEKKTLKTTSIVALAFVFCWTPYTYVVLWFQFDKDSYKSTNTLIMDFLFCFAVLNSVINPCVYSSHLFTKRRPSTVNVSKNVNKVNGNHVIRGTPSKIATKETFF